MPNTLSPEIVATVHHVTLNESGWWNRTLQRLILALLWLEGAPLSVEELTRRLKDNFGVDQDAETVHAAVQQLDASGDVVWRNGNGNGHGVKITESTAEAFSKEIEAFEQLDAAIDEHAYALLQKHVTTENAAQLWEEIKARLLVPLIHSMGAQMYDFLTGGGGNLTDFEVLDSYLSHFPSAQRIGIRTALVHILDPTDSRIRQYIWARMTATFCMHAGSLDKPTLDSIAHRTAQAHEITVFLDTNFLLSILDLHDNPSNESARRLLQLLSRLPGNFAVKLFILPDTLNETKHVLETNLRRAKSIHYSPAIYHVGADQVSGILGKYFENRPMRASVDAAESYFRPYIDDLVRIVRDKGVEIYGANTDVVRFRDDFTENMDRQMKFEEERYGDRAKTYEQLEHDLLLWHLVQDKRPAAVDSPIEAGYWAVTIDYRLLKFDRHKQKSRYAPIPACLHPASLVQMLQFWVPRSEELDSAMVDTFRLPFFVHEFDQDAENVTVTILSQLSRFKEAEEFDEGTVTKIVTDTALRGRIKNAKDSEKQLEEVQSAIASENIRLREKLTAADKNLGDKKSEVQKLQRKLQSVTDRASGVEENLERERQQRESLGERLAEMERAQRAEQEAKALSQRRARKTSMAIGGLVAAMAVSGSVVGIILGSDGWGPALRGSTAAALVMAGVWVLGMWYYGKADSDIRDWPPFRFYERVWHWVLMVVVLGAIVAGAQRWIWEATIDAVSLGGG